MVYIASDHGGYDLKKSVIKHLQTTKIDVTDIGPFEKDPDDDYPDYVFLLHKKCLRILVLTKVSLFAEMA